MATYIGSARIDENGKLNGGSGGDQKQKSTPDYKGEVSQQSFYVHKKGWIILRPKNRLHAQRIAAAMVTACNNIYLGYNQSKRLEVVTNGTNTKKPTNCDCSSLIRACVKEATGIDPGNFNTDNEAKTLTKTGLFEEPFEYTEGTVLYIGDVLVTKTKGHTVAVTGGNVRNESAAAPNKESRPTIRYGAKNEHVRYLHKKLKELKYGVDPKSDYFDSTTRICLINFQASHPPLEVDGVCGPKTWAALG